MKVFVWARVPFVTLLVLVLVFPSPLSGQEPVLDLSDGDCRGEVLISVIDGARVYASCDSKGFERIMRVSVSNQGAEAGPLRDFSIGFCGPSVIAGSAPEGWTTKVEGDEPHDITLSLPDDLVRTHGIPSGARKDGFIFILFMNFMFSGPPSRFGSEEDLTARTTPVTALRQA